MTRWRPGRLSITVYLAAMAAAIVIPFFLFVALLLWQLERREHIALGQRAVATAQSVASDIERQLRDMATTLRLLSSSPEIQNGELAAFHNRTQAALAGGNWFVLAVDAQGNQFLNTRVPFGTPLGRTSDPDSLVSALESDRVHVSNVFLGRTSGRYVFNVIQPLPPESRTRVAALIMTQNADELSRLLVPASMPADWSVALLDGQNRLIASSDPSIGSVGSTAPHILHPGADEDAGVVDIELAGDAGILAHSRLVGWSWRTVVWGPVRSGQAPILASWRNLFIGGFFLALVAGLAVFLLTEGLRRSIRGLSGMAHALGQGEIVSPAVTRISELDDVAFALSDASFDRSQAEEKLRFVTRELVHRTKNMLTLVQSMVRQTARRNPDVQAFLPAVSERLAGLARSIDLLTAEEWAGVPLNLLVRSQLATFVDIGERVTIDGPDFLLKAEAVQNLGLAFHELGTNATKYGALSVPFGKVAVTWKLVGDGESETIVLSWEESGGPEVAATEHEGFGTTVLERHIAIALAGEVKLSLRKSGLRWRLTAPRGNLEVAVRDKPAPRR